MDMLRIVIIIKEALLLFREMQVQGIKSSKVGMVSSLPACKLHPFWSCGKTKADIASAMELVNIYTKCGSIEDALCIFQKLPEKDVMTGTAFFFDLAVSQRWLDKKTRCSKKTMKVKSKKLHRNIVKNLKYFVAEPCVYNLKYYIFWKNRMAFAAGATDAGHNMHQLELIKSQGTVVYAEHMLTILSIPHNGLLICWVSKLIQQQANSDSSQLYKEYSKFKRRNRVPKPAEKDRIIENNS
ncbi:conserved hypothetical protein [Ricinus communis]|uniref:Pentatricopeptide repeat-containing protein n=1 Tax=Ricinus communis TaxID=3988 RepID=B9STN7_RICCO|nr:conserved hypothetical protein [Ricinus communis]